MQRMFFDVGTAREYHESETQQQEALTILRHRKLTKLSFERDWPGARLAPAIDILRNGWGFEIGGDGSSKSPYHLFNPSQSPARVRTTQKIKDLYWASEHFRDLVERRQQVDKHRCVICVGSCHATLQCHHFTYNLFAEKLDEVATVCVPHHQMIHDSKKGCKLSFPTGVETWIAERLLGHVAYPFEEWLLP